MDHIVKEGSTYESQIFQKKVTSKAGPFTYLNDCLDDITMSGRGTAQQGKRLVEAVDEVEEAEEASCCLMFNTS